VRLQNLEVLRFIAAIWVVLAHATGSLEARGLDVPLSSFFGFGGAGVDLFFVLSGFVIGLTQLQSPKSLGIFIRARLIRIVPAYWVVTLATLLVVGTLALGGMQFPAFSGLSLEWVLSSLGFVSLALGFENPFVYQGWTLEFEMLFYTLFAVAIVFFRRPGLQMLAASTLLMFLAFVEPGSLIQFEFTLGLLISFLTFKVRIGSSFAYTSVGLGAFLLWFLSDSTLFELPAVIDKGIPFALIVLGMANVRQLDSPLALRVGQSSYAVYLVQVLTIPAMMEVLSVVPSMPSILALLAIALVTQICGMLFEEVWDAKVRAFLQRSLPSKGAN
jgi:peptidoglycan/LPS O-acetylase OafA/YrhL